MISSLTDSIFHSLRGEWSIERTIYSFQGDFLGSFIGKALYKEIAPNLLHYREEGVLRREECESCAFKDYYYFYDKGISIFFDRDLTRLFYEMQFESERSYPVCGKGIHHCKEDVYTMSYTFFSEKEYSTKVSVMGPRKNYDINSVLNFLQLLS